MTTRGIYDVEAIPGTEFGSTKKCPEELTKYEFVFLYEFNNFFFGTWGSCS
jgi:hypothetical protein